MFRFAVRRPLSCAFTLLSLFPAAADLHAQEPAERTRIGLALSGGGARGIAHVGVLRVLEEHCIPIDFIAGTSMGAVVGGLYATGLSPDEIEAALAVSDWERLLSDKPVRRSLDFRRREDDRRYVWEIEMGVDGGGLRLPGGLIAGQELGQLLRGHTWHAVAVDSFTRLPVPFLAVATDIEHGTMEVLREGDLAEALRASLSIPTVFAPVEIGGRLLVDGGLTNNLPVDLVRSMGAEVVIAVDVSVPLLKADEVRSLIDVLEQSIAIVSRTRVGEQIERADVAILPDVRGIGIFDLEAGERLVARGEAAARGVQDRLVDLTLPPAAWEEYLRVHRRKPQPPSHIGEVVFDVPAWLDRRRLAARVRLREGERLEPSRLTEEVQRLYALGEFERVDYDLKSTGDGAVVKIDADEKEWGPGYLDFGLRLVTDSGADDFRTGLVTFDGVIDITRTRIGSRGAEWRNDVRFGQSSGVESEWYQPLDFGGRWFVAGGVGYLSTEQPVFQDRRLAAEYGVDRGALGVDVGRRLGGAAEVRIGLRRAWVDAAVDAGSATFPPEAGSGALPSFDVDQVALAPRLVIDRLDDVSFPHTGIFLRFEGLLSREGLGSHRSYDRVDLEAQGFATAGRHTGFASLGLGTSLGSDLPAYDDFRIGGFLSLTGFGEDALRGDDALVARLGYTYRLLRFPPALRGLYLAAWVEGGNVWQRTRDIDLGDLLLTGTVAIGADTGLGPVFVAYGAAEDGDDRVYVAIGTLF